MGYAPGLLGVVLAGGESSRFGSPKGLTPLGGRPMAAWAKDALAPHFAQRVVIANEPGVPRVLELPGRKDTVPGMGPLGGLATALAWAKEEGLAGAFLLGCDLPLVTEELLGRILKHSFRGENALVPASSGPLGMEPLCAAYSVECLDVAEELLVGERRSMKVLLDAVGYTLAPMEALGGEVEVSRAFLNVNTREDARYVEEFLRGGEGLAGELRFHGDGLPKA
jgi:molybdopterin-guanine dinucleotide biosynthesis protein A